MDIYNDEESGKWGGGRRRRRGVWRGSRCQTGLSSRACLQLLPALGSLGAVGGFSSSSVERDGVVSMRLLSRDKGYGSPDANAVLGELEHGFVSF